MFDDVALLLYDGLLLGAQFYFMGCVQCDQIGQFIGLWATFQSLWKQLFCPNFPHS